MNFLYRGNPAMVIASSIIIPINNALVLRGRLGQQLQAIYGPVPQNQLLVKAPLDLGQTAIQQVNAPAFGVPARWYVSVAYPFANLSATWLQQNLAGVQQALQTAVDQVLAEGQFPCAVPFFVEHDSLANDPACLNELAQMMVAIVPDGKGFYFVADAPNAYDALSAALTPPQAPEVLEEVVPETVAETPADDPAILDATVLAVPQKRRGRPRKAEVSDQN